MMQGTPHRVGGLPPRGGSARAARHAALATFALTLAACAAVPFVGGPSVARLEETRQFAAKPLDQTWASPRGSLVMIERDLGPEAEQIVGLANPTTIEGDNFLWLRARRPDRLSGDSFDLRDFMSRAPAVPAPFTTVSDDNLKRGQDSIGPYFYLEWRSGGQANCVLAFRRIDNADGLLPGDASILEVMLRNCTMGSVADALLPIRDAQIGVTPMGGIPVAVAAGGSGRMISPLAAPPSE